MALTQISTDGIKSGTITGSDLATNVDLVDNQKLRFGNSNDLQIYHNGANTFIDNFTGYLLLRSTSGNNYYDAQTHFIRNAGGSENLAKFIQNGAVELYYDNSKKFETTSGGATLTGSLTADEIQLGDGEMIRFGSDSDCLIEHTGTVLEIDNNTGGTTFDSADTIHFRVGSNETAAKFIPNGAVELYHNNSKKFETTSSGTTISGNLIANTASGRSTELHASGLGITRDSKTLDLNANYAGANTHSQINSNQTQLRLGINNSDTLRVTADSTILADNKTAIFGNHNDLQIYHDGSDSYIKHNGTGNFYVQTTEASVEDLYLQAGNDVYIRVQTGENAIKCTGDAGVELFFDGTAKLETRAGDTIFHDDIRIQDNNKINIGTGDDIQIYHDGFDSRIHNLTGNFLIRNEAASGNIFLRTKTSESAIDCIPDGAVNLYYDGSKKLSTTSDGIRIDAGEAGEAIINFFADEGDDANDKYRIVAQDSGDLVFQRNTGSAFSSELRVKSAGGIQANYLGSEHFRTESGGAAIVDSNDSTSLRLEGSGGTSGYLTGVGSTVIGLVDNVGHYHIKGTKDGSTELYHDNSQRLKTVSNGIQVAYMVAAVSGNNLEFNTESNHEIRFRVNGTLRYSFDTSGHFVPYLNNTYDIGTTSNRIRNIYTNDLNLSNEGGSNDVDGTWGSYTIQEGAEDLFLVNKRNGKKYKFNLTEVS